MPVDAQLPTLRKLKDCPVTLSINGRTVSLVLRVRPIAPQPSYHDFVVFRDEAPDATIIQGEAGDVTGGWWVELMDGTGSAIVGAMRLVKTTDLWYAHNALLRGLFGAHLLLACTGTPSGAAPLYGQCEITLAPAALA